MKKCFAILTAVAMLTAILSFGAFAEDAPSSPTVSVTVSDGNGALVLTQEPVEVSDIDSDGKLTVNDALYLAHEAKYNGGAEAGYASSVGSWGLSLDKLWGVANGGSYGYYVNDQMAMSLTDELEDGDRLHAYILQDTATWSDQYSYFDRKTADITVGNSVTLTLSAIGFDANFNPVSTPVAGAVITVNGEETAFVTDSNGAVTVTVSEVGAYTVSAVSDTLTLVPASCIVNVTAITDTPTDTVAPNGEQTADPDTPSDTDGLDKNTVIALSVLVAIVLVIGIADAIGRHRKNKKQNNYYYD